MLLPVPKLFESGIQCDECLCRNHQTCSRLGKKRFQLHQKHNALRPLRFIADKCFCICHGQSDLTGTDNKPKSEKLKGNIGLGSEFQDFKDETKQIKSLNKRKGILKRHNNSNRTSLQPRAESSKGKNGATRGGGLLYDRGGRRSTG